MSQNLLKLGLILLATTALASLALFDNGRVSMVLHGWVNMGALKPSCLKGCWP
jgi:hypothetical protein